MDDVDVQTTLFQGIDAKAHAYAELGPRLVGDTIAAIIAAAWAITTWAHEVSTIAIATLGSSLLVASALPPSPVSPSRWST